MKKTGILIICFATYLLGQGAPSPKQADFERRFKEAVAAIGKEDYITARKICDGIIQEEPKARGSLLIAGMASLELFESAKAIEYLDAFRKIEPNDPQGILFSIQAHQGDKRTAKVEALLKELIELRKTNLKLQSSDEFIRERFKTADNQMITVREFYEIKKQPYHVWEVSEMSLKTNTLTRSLHFSYNVGSAEVAAKGEAYFLGETILKEGKPQQINIYREEKTKPDYSTFRKWIVDAIKLPPKPIYTAPFSEQQVAP